ncbi:MAG TPA: hypothetical protein DCZ75_12910 [Geobacter sp.]|nr:hypothetical protein [Geobacter sp.]
MNMFTAMMMTVTLTMTAVMVPRIYMSWMLAEERCIEGEIEPLLELLAEQNSWVLRQFGCGAIAFALIWMVRTSQHDLEIPAAMEAALAIYTAISMVFAVLESLIAQRISDFISCVPGSAVTVKIREDN